LLFLLTIENWDTGSLCFPDWRWRARQLRLLFAPENECRIISKCDARRRHARRPLPREDFGKSRFKGGYAKSS
jgi:hypothetical protein